MSQNAAPTGYVPNSIEGFFSYSTILRIENPHIKKLFDIIIRGNNSEFAGTCNQARNSNVNIHTTYPMQVNNYTYEISLLSAAAMFGRREVTAYLLENGASISSDLDFFHPIMISWITGNYDILKILCEKIPNLEELSIYVGDVKISFIALCNIFNDEVSKNIVESKMNFLSRKKTQLTGLLLRNLPLLQMMRFVDPDLIPGGEIELDSNKYTIDDFQDKDKVNKLFIRFRDGAMVMRESIITNYEVAREKEMQTGEIIPLGTYHWRNQVAKILARWIFNLIKIS